jgi:hypothetical protein
VPQGQLLADRVRLGRAAVLERCCKSSVHLGLTGDAIGVEAIALALMASSSLLCSSVRRHVANVEEQVDEMDGQRATESRGILNSPLRYVAELAAPSHGTCVALGRVGKMLFVDHPTPVVQRARTERGSMRVDTDHKGR